ncbi:MULTISPECIES: hypothetical protein [unclassified Paludibacterium]|uniref:hypothetical protein n=1 Tax=unclassified Paludibacterium TaxID=2618429 RepID=UPI001C042ECF|nr:hypothetical protein [Paludibacterium sp. B53371]BEV71786.1 hypothetical protein THUN1379_12680 [Paludibacterium sp. THUN1379]
MTGKHQLGAQILRWIHHFQAVRAARHAHSATGDDYGMPHGNCHCSFCEEYRDIKARSQDDLPHSH